MIAHFRSYVLALLAVAAASPAWADVRLPALFTDHMVLQQGQKNRVWGWAEPGEPVTVSIDKQEHKATADDKGRWTVTLESLPVGGPYVLAVKGKNEIKVQDVLVGEVWICSGQSNMGFALSQATDGDLEAATARFPNIRLISVPQVGTQEPQDDFKGKWTVCSPKEARIRSNPSIRWIRPCPNALLKTIAQLYSRSNFRLSVPCTTASAHPVNVSMSLPKFMMCTEYAPGGRAAISPKTASPSLLRNHSMCVKPVP